MATLHVARQGRKGRHLLVFRDTSIHEYAVLQTVRMAYSKALQAALPSVLERAQAGEKLKFN